MLVVWKFYCGLMKVDSTGSMFEAVVSKTASRALHNIQCAYESQQKNPCKVVLEKADGTLDFHKEHLTIPDFTALGYVLASNHAVYPVSLSLHSPDSVGIDALLTEAGSHCFLQTLKYASDTFDDKALYCLKKLLQISGTLVAVNLFASEATTESCLDAISEAISKSCSEVSELSVTNIRIGPKNMKYILDKCKDLKKIALHNSIGTQEITTLANKLINGGESIKTLDISFNFSKDATLLKSGVAITFELCSKFENVHCNIVRERVHLSLSRHTTTSLESTQFPTQNSDDRSNTVNLDKCPRAVVAACADGIKNIRHLEELKVNASNCYEELLNLMHNLSKHISLKIVDLDGASLITTTAKALFSSLKHCSDLSTLNLRGSRITKEGVECMTFQCWPNLQELNLDGTKNDPNIDRSGAEVLANNLDSFDNLSKLHLEYNNIDDKLRLLFFRKLLQKKHFTALYLSHNPVAREWNRTIHSPDIAAAVAQSSTTQCILM